MITASLALLLLGVPAHSDEDEMPEIFPYRTHVENLDNGLKVVLIPMSSGGLVAYWTVVRTGSRDEVEYSDRLLSAMRHQFGGHAVKQED